MDKKINIAIDYYTKKGQDILNVVNTKTNLTADELIHYGEEMAILEYKLTALEVAKEN
ncbi:hypothetical protein [Winogradskyella sp. PE311]|uniref:hypothetical protein n=1 Tax=Winogradskyella sp. PE311 TaxID=3366943 RepID=UPI00397EB787